MSLVLCRFSIETAGEVDMCRQLTPQVCVREQLAAHRDDVRPLCGIVTANGFRLRPYLHVSWQVLTWVSGRFETQGQAVDATIELPWRYLVPSIAILAVCAFLVGQGLPLVMFALAVAIQFVALVATVLWQSRVGVTRIARILHGRVTTASGLLGWWVRRLRVA